MRFICTKNVVFIRDWSVHLHNRTPVRYIPNKRLALGRKNPCEAAETVDMQVYSLRLSSRSELRRASIQNKLTNLMFAGPCNIVITEE